MATAPIEVVGLPTGQTLTLTLYPRGSDTAAASGLSLTENTNNKGVYRTTTAAGLTGWHRAVVLLSTTVIAIFDVLMDDTTDEHYCHDASPEALYPVTKQRALQVESDGMAHADVKEMLGDATSVINQKTALQHMLIGTVDDSNFAPTTTEFESNDIALTVQDILKGVSIIVTSGPNKYERARINAYEKIGSNGHFTVSELTAALSDGDTFIVV